LAAEQARLVDRIEAGRALSSYKEWSSYPERDEAVF